MIQSQQDKTGAQPGRDWMLVVDDDEPFLELIVSAMTDDALEVVTATSAPAAFQTLDQRAVAPLLVLTDVLMPGMDGLTLARKLSARLTRSKIAVMSGNLSDVSWWPADLRDLVFLAKPFRLTELTAVVDAARAEFKTKL